MILKDHSCNKSLINRYLRTVVGECRLSVIFVRISLHSARSIRTVSLASILSLYGPCAWLMHAQTVVIMFVIKNIQSERHFSLELEKYRIGNN